jgi:hypothetical protein
MGKVIDLQAYRREQQLKRQKIERTAAAELKKNAAFIKHESRKGIANFLFLELIVHCYSEDLDSGEELPNLPTFYNWNLNYFRYHATVEEKKTLRNILFKLLDDYKEGYKLPADQLRKQFDESLERLGIC